MSALLSEKTEDNARLSATLKLLCDNKATAERAHAARVEALETLIAERNSELAAVRKVSAV